MNNPDTPAPPPEREPRPDPAAAPEPDPRPATSAAPDPEPRPAASAAPDPEPRATAPGATSEQEPAGTAPAAETAHALGPPTAHPPTKRHRTVRDRAGNAVDGRRGMAVDVLTRCDDDAVPAKLESGEFFWLHMEDPTDEELDHLGHVLHLHPLAVRAAKTFDQRPKLDIYDRNAYLVYYGAHPRESGLSLLHEVHLFISGDYIITIHRGEDDALTELREAVPQRTVKSKQFLIYEVLASIADSYFPLLAAMDEELDSLSTEILDRPSSQQLRHVNTLKHELTTLRRVVTPQRDIFARNIEELQELDGLEGDHPEYFRDIYDHLIRVSDLVDSYRDLASGATDLYLSTVANRQGEVGKQLAIIATIFLPLTFLTGFFGQNFSYLTGKILDTPWSFYVLGLGSLAVSVAILLWFFRHKGWLGDTTAAPTTRRHGTGATRARDDHPQ